VIGETVNNYVIRSVLGEGGMGTVYLAEHPKIGRKAAIKILRRELCDDATLVVRFTNEAKAANAIRHPNIIEILDVGELANGAHYLMMEYLEGESLRERLKREGRLGVEQVVEIGAAAASGLAAAHAKHIVHRDLKPDNLFLVPDDHAPSGERVKVLDFGIAKLKAELSGVSVQTHTGLLMGTPAYMSPEQCKGISSEIDHRSDIYALGIILHEMLAGEPPFTGEGFGEVLMKHMMSPPVPLRQIDAEIPEHVEAAVLRALAKSPAERFSSMFDLEAALTKGVFRSSPRLRAPATDPALRPDTRSSRPTTGITATTLSRASGVLESQPGATMGGLAPAAPRKRGAWIAIGGAIVAALVGVSLLASRAGSGHNAPAAGAASAAGAVQPAAASPAAAPSPVAPRPPSPAAVQVAAPDSAGSRSSGLGSPAPVPAAAAAASPAAAAAASPAAASAPAAAEKPSRARPGKTRRPPAHVNRPAAATVPPPEPTEAPKIRPEKF
jgi:tRNA A-37 threonylcarbamoyl transferase component Bud32